MKKVIIVLLLFSFLIIGGFVFSSSSFMKKDKDIIKYGGRTYSNITELNWFEKEKSRYKKGKRIGEIKNNIKSPLLLWDFSATKLPEGTLLYSTVGTNQGIKPLIILAEMENAEILYYRWLPKE